MGVLASPTPPGTNGHRNAHVTGTKRGESMMGGPLVKRARGRIVRASLGAVVILTMTLVGLSSSAASAAAKPKSGGTVTFGGIAGVVSLNPSITTGNSTAGLNELEALYGILMRYDTKSKQFVPDMAQSLTHNADYTV